MLVFHRNTGEIEHRRFTEINHFISPNDLLVLNDSKVIPARLRDRSGTIEILLLEKQERSRWTAMVKPGRKMKVGTTIEVAGVSCTVEEILEGGTRLINFSETPDLDRYGEMPIPPYFHRRADEEDKERYQTVYAQDPGSVAAPTAGLHFTPEILASLRHAFLTLHVGAGTFQPVKVDNLSDHRMHLEHYTLPATSALMINETKRAGGRIVCVGTTSCRVLESQSPGELAKVTDSTDIFIRPPHEFRHVNALLTNFHLPGSTLLVLVSAMIGREATLAAYAEAVREGYRFFSYGDCMLIV
jgi:S-adenosylmethionine:tRNA ribosyltransferase-isomerase